MMARRAGVLAVSFVALTLGACGEIDQVAKSEKIYAGKRDTRAADGAAFGGDKKKWEAAIEQRASTQNERNRATPKT